MEFLTIESVLVFKTNIIRPEEVEKLSSIFETKEDISEWNFDLGDCDHILRVVSNGIMAGDVIKIVDSIGFQCEELPD